ncbi:MAG: hypothetical protein E6I52_27200 [Chloroflexi bacterium]|nr:MAG: hypothetical protein E6I52_27200 [Chloroflexota bacterium]
MPGAVSRRQFLRRAALVSGGLALTVACGPQAGGPPAPEGSAPGQAQPAQQAPVAGQPQPTPATAGAPKKGGVLRVGLYVEAATMDPHLSGSKIYRQIYHNIFDPLVVIDDKLEVKPNLAESWQTPDPRTLIFKLRQGVKFHDGTDFNAEAAKFNFDRMATEPKSVRKGEVANIASAEVVDAYTLKLNLKQPDAPLLATLTDRAGMMISPAAIKKFGADLEHDITGAGTGPFQFAEWVKDDHLLLKRNENYWNKDAGPYLEQVRYRPIPDDTVKLQPAGWRDRRAGLSGPAQRAACQNRHQSGGHRRSVSGGVLVPAQHHPAAIRQQGAASGGHVRHRHGRDRRGSLAGRRRARQWTDLTLQLGLRQ